MPSLHSVSVLSVKVVTLNIEAEVHFCGTETSWRFIDSSSEEASARADMWFVITEDNGQYWSGPRGAVMNTDPWADIKNATDDPAALLDRVNISGPPLNTKQLHPVIFTFMAKLFF